jgi:hypothetical protein
MEKKVVRAVLDLPPPIFKWNSPDQVLTIDDILPISIVKSLKMVLLH